MPGVILVVWTALLIFAFLNFRGADVGQLPALTRSFLGSLSPAALFSPSGLAASVLGPIIAALIVLSWYGLGNLLVHLARGRREATATDSEETVSRAFEWARACALGAGAWSLIWFALGLIRAYNRPLACLALLAGLSLAVVSYLRRQGGPDGASGEAADRPGRVAFLLTVLSSALALLAALAPPVARDTLLYHISLPKVYIAAGGFTDAPNNIASFLPMGAEMLSVWAMLLGQLLSDRAAEAAAGATQFAFFPLLTAFVYGWARELGLGRSWSLLAALLISSVPTIYYVAASGYIDLALSLYVALAVRSVARWWKTLDREQLVCAALALGFALCIKLTAIFVLFPLALVVLLRARQAQEDEGAAQARGASVGRIAMNGLLALVLAGVVASPWYIRTWAQTGSPVFPFYLNIWKGSAPGWDVERSLWFQEINSRYGGYPKNLFSYVATPVRLSVMGQPDLPAYYDGVIGVAFLFGLPLIIWAWRREGLDVELRIGVVVSAVLFVFWLFSSEQARYLLPALPALAVAVAASGSFLADLYGRKSRPIVEWTLIAVALLTGTLVILAWFMEQNPLRVVLGGESRRDYLSRRLDYYPYYEMVNSELPAQARVWLINMRRDTYNLERPYFSDYMFEDYTIRKYVDEAASLEELRARVRADGITHLLVRHDLLLDLQRSPIIDERRTPEQNLAKMRLLNSFLLDGTRVLRRDNRFMLIELPAR
jgi:Dolichyl-phosphate-mannose-protein mannosyltransferase